jgi:hypothetical protein
MSGSMNADAGAVPASGTGTLMGQAIADADARGYQRGLAERFADHGLLTEAEHAAIEAAGALWNQLCRIVGHRRTRAGDLNELAAHIHGIQRAVMKQAAARAYPERYRLLGQTIVPIGQLAAESPDTSMSRRSESA